MRILFSVILATLFPLTALAQNTVESEGYAVHYSTSRTNELSPEVARQYGLTRSEKRAIVLISVTLNSDKDQPVGLPATVSGKATNLLSQARDLQWRRIKADDSIYHLAEFSFDHLETLTFILQVHPKGASETIPVRFHQKFYRDPG